MNRQLLYTRLLLVALLTAFNSGLYSQCNASFLYSVGPAGTVSFTSTSTGTTASTSYSWDYGNNQNYSGVGVGGMYANTTYTSPSMYLVMLYIVDASTSCTTSVVQTITVTNLCSLQASCAINMGAPGSATLVNLSQNTTAATTYSVDWGDGTINTLSTHQYTVSGSFSPVLTADGSTTGFPCVSQFTAQAVNVCLLQANASINVGSAGIATLTNLSSGITAGTTYTVDWGDGTINAQFTHQYPVPGTYTLIFTAQSNSTIFPCVSQYTAPTLTVSCLLSPSFTLAQSGGSVNLVNTSTGTLASTTYTIDWGDGFFDINTFATHQYTAAGTYSITLFASNNGALACFGNIMNTVNIIPPPCSLVANFTVNLLPNGDVYTVNLSTGTISATTYSMFWSDGTTNGTNPHHFNINGIESCTLYADNQTIGCTLYAVQFFTVTSVCVSTLTPTFTYNFDPAAGTITLSSTTTGTTNTTMYQWYYAPLGGTLIPFGTAATTVNILPTIEDTTYVLELELYDLNSPNPSCHYTSTQFFNSYFCGEFLHSSPFNNSVHFSSVNTATTQATKFLWDFGDLTTGSGPHPTHVYSSAGSYLVKLTVKDSTYPYICSQHIPVNIPSCLIPPANFYHTVLDSGLAVFNGSVVGATSYTWDFGDGYYSVSGASLTHVYTSNGAFTVHLTIADTNCSSSITRVINITGASCQAQADFAMNATDTAGYAFISLANPWTAESAHWDWGDGSFSDSLYTSHTYSTPGTYTVCLRITASCGDTAVYCSSQIVNGSEGSLVHLNVHRPVSILEGLREYQNEKLYCEIYPDPSNGEFTLKLTNKQREEAGLAIYDLLGTRVYEDRFDPDTFIKIIHAEVLPSGIYFVRIAGKEKSITRKIIISR